MDYFIRTTDQKNKLFPGHYVPLQSWFGQVMPNMADDGVISSVPSLFEHFPFPVHFGWSVGQPYPQTSPVPIWQQMAPAATSRVAPAPLPLQAYLQSLLMSEYIDFRTGGETENINNAVTAPVSAAVAHTFALARVSAPIICPEA